MLGQEVVQFEQAGDQAIDRVAPGRRGRHQLRHVVEHREDQFTLVGDVPVQRHRRGAELRRDPPDRDRVQALRLDDTEPRTHDHRPGQEPFPPGSGHTALHLPTVAVTSLRVPDAPVGAAALLAPRPAAKRGTRAYTRRHTCPDRFAPKVRFTFGLGGATDNLLARRPSIVVDYSRIVAFLSRVIHVDNSGCRTLRAPRDASVAQSATNRTFRGSRACVPKISGKSGSCDG